MKNLDPKIKKPKQLEDTGPIKGELNALQKRFCEEFLIDLNGTKAAERAGYKKKSAASQASRLLTDDKITQYVSELKANRAVKTQTDAERVVMELKSLAFSNLKKIASWGDDGKLIIVASEDMSDEVAACIESIKMDRTVLESTYTRDDMDESETTEKEIKSTLTVKLHRKVPALLLLMKHLGMLGDKEDDENPILKKALADIGRGR